MKGVMRCSLTVESVEEEIKHPVRETQVLLGVILQS
jgi:hypothetical protein